MITNYKKNYETFKNNALNYYNELLSIVDSAGIPKDDTSLQNLKLIADRIKEDNYCLMVAGEAKSGKSTFINAYLGDEILPMDVRQCTNSVVEIKYGSKFILCAAYADERIKTITGDENIRSFLTSNAAIDDKYRDIPVTTIDNEIIALYKNKKIDEEVIQKLLKEVERENIHHLSLEEYNKKIREYIKIKQPHWNEIVVKITIEYPFKDESMRGIRIIDSPGVNAVGKVGDVTGKFIENADAIMFLRPISGVAIEANSFKDFLESKSVGLNKNAKFLVLTNSANKTENDIKRSLEEFFNIFGNQNNDNVHGILKEQIIPIDSKAELFYNRYFTMPMEEIREEIKKLKSEGNLEQFVKGAWFDADGDKDAFLSELRHISNFNSINNSLKCFGHKAHFLQLSDFLGNMLSFYPRIRANLKTDISDNQKKAENPDELAALIEKTNAERIEIENRIFGETDSIINKYSSIGENGLIEHRANETMKKYKAKIEKITGKDKNSMDQIEELSLQQIEKFKEFESDLQKKVIAECNETLKVVLSDNNTVEFALLEPDFSKETIERLRKEIEDDKTNEAHKPYYYTTGHCNNKTRHTGYDLLPDKYYAMVKSGIYGELENIKNAAISDLRNYVVQLVNAYRSELQKNLDNRIKKLNELNRKKETADEIYSRINELNLLLDSIEPKIAAINECKGVIDSNA